MGFKKIGACWKSKGEGYSCKLEETVEEGGRFFIFKNKHKKEDKHPDLVIGVFEDDEPKAEEPEDDMAF